MHVTWPKSQLNTRQRCSFTGTRRPKRQADLKGLRHYKSFKHTRKCPFKKWNIFEVSIIKMRLYICRHFKYEKKDKNAILSKNSLLISEHI